MGLTVQQAIKVLADTKAGWVHRRDAADALGKAAAAAAAALREHAKDPDTDVRAAAARALETAKARLAGVMPKPEGGYSLERLARACEKTGKRTVREDKDGYAIEVALKEGRHQVVYLRPFESSDGRKLLRLYSFCSRGLDDAVTARALRTNAKLGLCALAIVPAEDGERLALVRCFLQSDATPEDIRAALKEITLYGDWLEQKLTGLDEF